MQTLVLVPTIQELDSIRRPIADAAGQDCALEICGFGPILAAARTAALLSQYRPQRVLLVGIAGSYDCDRLGIGTACRFERVVCEGVGSGAGSSYRSAGAMGWYQFEGDTEVPQIGDLIRLDETAAHDPQHAPLLVTCTAASASQEEAAQRRTRHPGAVAEDMEGFGVAAACKLAAVPLQIVRGISNRAGDRNHQHWDIEAALQAAAELACAGWPYSGRATAP